MNIFLVDIGATKIRCASSDGRRLRAVTVRPTPPHWEDAQNLIAETAQQTLRWGSIERTILGVPGMVSTDRKRVLAIPNLPSWPANKIVRDVQRITKGSVIVENDAALNALGEARYGAGRSKKIVAFLTISTGVNGARIVDGQFDAHAFPVELRHLLVRYRNRSLTLGQAISGRSLEQQYQRKPETIVSDVVWRAVTVTLADVLVNLGLAWAPDVFVIGGSVSASIPLHSLRREVQARWRHRYPAPAIVKGALGDRSGLYGALALVKKI